LVRAASVLFSLALLGGVVFVGFSSLKVLEATGDWPFDLRLTFGLQMLKMFVGNSLPVIMGLLTFLYLAHSLSDLAAGHLLRMPGKVIILIVVTGFVFLVSCVPFTVTLSKDLAYKLPKDLIDLAQATTPFHLSNSYGTFQK